MRTVQMPAVQKRQPILTKATQNFTVENVTISELPTQLLFLMQGGLKDFIRLLRAPEYAMCLIDFPG